MEQLRVEINRARDRLHKLEGIVGSHATRLRELRRDVGDLERRMRAVEMTTQHLVNEDAIADRVSQRVAERDSRTFTRWQTWGIRVAIASAISSPIITAVWK